MTTGQYIAEFISVASNLLFFAILLRACLSWFAVDLRGSGAARLLVDVTEPILGPLRRVVPPIGSIDISPLIAMILVQAIANVLTSQLH
jgi:YggT family protein